MKLQPVGSILILCSLLLAGCEDSVVEALKVPVATLSAPTFGAGLNAISATESAEMTLSFSQTVSTTLAAASGSSASPPAGITVSTSGTAVCSSVATSVVSIAGATITVGGCTGNGTVTVRASAGIATSETERTNSMSNSRSITVDNVKPTAVSMTIASAYSQSATGSNTVTLTFSKPILALSATNADNAFSITTGCATPPAVGVAMSLNGSNQSVATITLSGGSCVDATTVSVGFNLSKATDLAGNDGLVAGSPANVVYTVDSTTPSLALGAAVYDTPAGGPADVSTVVTLAVTYSNADTTVFVNNSTYTTASTVPGLTIVSDTAICDLDIASASLTGANIILTNCTGDGSFTFTVNANAVSSSSGLQSAASVSRTVLVDN